MSRLTMELQLSIQACSWQNSLPNLLWKPSPNFSSRRGTRVDLIVLHDCEGGYEGAVAWFATRRSNVSAHLVIREDGDEATQMVDLADNAWHACAFNQRSVGVEMSGFASRGFRGPLLATAARICAYFCHHCRSLFGTRALASDRASPRITILARQEAAITIPRTTRRSWRRSFRQRVTGFARAISPIWGAVQAAAEGLPALTRSFEVGWRGLSCASCAGRSHNQWPSTGA